MQNVDMLKYKLTYLKVNSILSLYVELLHGPCASLR